MVQTYRPPSNAPSVSIPTEEEREEVSGPANHRNTTNNEPDNNGAGEADNSGATATLPAFLLLMMTALTLSALILA